MSHRAWLAPLAMTLMSGLGEAWYLGGYESYAALETDQKNVDKTPVLARELERLSQVDGELLSGTRNVLARNSLRRRVRRSGRQQLRDFARAGMASSETRLFGLSPKMSYMSDEFVARDPLFWAPKPVAAAKP